MALVADNTANIADNTKTISANTESLVNNISDITYCALYTANNTRRTEDFLEKAFGLFMIFFGLITLCGFGIVFVNNINKFNPSLCEETVEYDVENDDYSDDAEEEDETEYIQETI